MATIVQILVVVMCYMGTVCVAWGYNELDIRIAQVKRDGPPEQCLAAAETGNCRAYIPGWFYNVTSSACDQFVWGGCPGTPNMFHTREDCISICSSDTCSLAAEVGPCRAQIRSWFYDADQQQCLEFSYGGCAGNENRFTTRDRCEQACASSSLGCKPGDEFVYAGAQAVTEGAREEDWFTYSCHRRCRLWCLEDTHTWGVCLAFSIRDRWYGCDCYLFDQPVSEAMFNPDTTGVTRNRACESPEPEDEGGEIEGVTEEEEENQIDDGIDEGTWVNDYEDYEDDEGSSGSGQPSVEDEFSDNVYDY